MCHSLYVHYANVLKFSLQMLFRCCRRIMTRSLSPSLPLTLSLSLLYGLVAAAVGCPSAAAASKNPKANAFLNMLQRMLG